MFSKNSEDNKVQPKATVQPIAEPKASHPSLISSDVHIVGDLKSSGEIQIDGVVDGDIRSQILEVGKSATINGEIVADKVRVNGTINGRIKARSVELFSSAHVVGDVMHEDLSIETGAFLEGHCKRNVKSDTNQTKSITKK